MGSSHSMEINKKPIKENNVESFESSDKILDVYITPNVNFDQKIFSLKLGSNPEYLENPMGPSGRIYSCRLKRLKKHQHICQKKNQNILEFMKE